MASEKTNAVFRSWKQAEQNKSPWNQHFDDLARVMLPRRVGFSTTTVEGERRTEDIFDSTPMQGARGLANAVASFMEPAGIPEVKVQAERDDLNELDEVKEWLEESGDRLKNAFNNPKAKYREANGEIKLDLVVLGTGVKFIGQSRQNLLFQSVHLKDAAILFDEEGNPNSLFRQRRMPIRHVVERFGENNLSDGLKQRFKTNSEDKIPILHAVTPRKNGNSTSLLSKNLPFADQWFEIETRNILTEKGFHEFPFVVPRWDTSSGEDFGRSPGMIALPDADTLQAMGETILVAGQRAADPPLAVPNDGSFDAINTFPGGLVYYDVESAVAVRGNPFFPLESGMNLPISRDMQQDTRQQVWAAFFRNVLNLPVEGPEMTATEVIARKQEFMREVGPTFGRLESSDTAPTVERSFMVMLRAGGFPPIPEVLSEANIRFEYDSPTKRIQKQIDAAAARLWAEETILLSQSKPAALDLINEDGLVRLSAEAKGIPGDAVNTPDVVAQIRDQRQKQMEAQSQLEGMQESVELLKGGAEAAQKAGITNG